MDEVTAEIIERGRQADADRSAQRRRIASQMKTAREKLTSSGSGQRTFDIELLRVFAERRRGATLVLIVLALAAGGLASIWVQLPLALAWVAVVICSTLLMSQSSARFLRSDRTVPQLLAWERTFVGLDALQSFAWASIVLLMLDVTDPVAQTFVLFVLLLFAAMTAVVSASVPMAVYAGLLPIFMAVIGFLGPMSGGRSLPLLVVASGALFYSIILAKRLYAISLDTLTIQAEKDALIVELEQARLNSDEARRRAEEASLAKSRFLATMSHELRTPLNAILGFSEVMKGELFGAHTVLVYRDYSADIHASGQHLLMLINEILDLSRVEAGRYDLREEPIALSHIVEDCRHLLSLRAAKREITMSELIEDDLPRIWADERAIRQVILNLLSNAIKFTPQGGGITIKVGWTAQGGQYASIRDTGPGIPETEIPVVMSSFGRGTLAQKNAEEGSGLGLPIVKGLVELHSGSFILRSKVREGTEAIVIMPPERVMNALPQFNPDEGQAQSRSSARRRGNRPAA